eukprot:Opistho-1_new@75773
MVRLLTLMLCAFALLSIGTAPIAHAVERTVCIEVSRTLPGADTDHAKSGAPDTDMGDKNVAHQHGGCHGHHYASPADMPVATELTSRDDMRVRGPTSALAPAALDPALRPPQA